MKKQSTIDLFNKYMKKGKLDKFNNYLIENNLRDKFIEDATWYSPYHYKDNTDKLEESLNNYTLMLLKDDACQKYGNLGDKFCEYIYSQESEGLKRSNMFLLDRILKSSNYTNLDNVSQIFDMACDENNVIGTHITGSQIGDIISDEGIALTGHKFVATDSLTNNNSKYNVKGTLEKNITFFKNQPFELLWNLTSGRKYNNYTRENFNDIMLVSIPENDLNNNKEDIIIQNDSSLYLNPSYIKGYAKINTVDGDIKDIKENPRFINKNYHELYNQRESNYDYRQKLDQWYKDINTTKFGKIFSKVKGIFSKKENKMLPAGDGDYKNPNYSTAEKGTSFYDGLKSYKKSPEDIYPQDLGNSPEIYHRDNPNELDDRY
jgi:hypothetical protein